MGNLGGYQRVIEITKMLGGPGKAVAIGLAVVGGAGYGVLRIVEAGSKKGFAKLKAYRARGEEPCAVKGRTFVVRKSGTDSRGKLFAAGEEYRVLDCPEEDVIVIAITGDDESPYVVSGQFLSTISDFYSER